MADVWKEVCIDKQDEIRRGIWMCLKGLHSKIHFLHEEELLALQVNPVKWLLQQDLDPQGDEW